MSETADNLLSPSQSKGGLKYELILEKPSNETPPKVVGRPLDQPKQLSAEVIEAKLKEAEERRKSFEAQKILQAKERFSHVSELKDKRSEIEEQKIELTRQSLEKKMEASKENRETHIKAIQEKQKEHGEKVAEVVKRKSEVVPDSGNAVQ
ncbi:stathmin-3-like [Oppia nitens]|uniref:stathmin-3-like n=1 Tax=Oppia nitens TaxID=1686743 RepID=UPI0023DCDBA5|nr:stathmin-3-like [Oppia nitens]